MLITHLKAWINGATAQTREPVIVTAQKRAATNNDAPPAKKPKSADPSGKLKENARGVQQPRGRHVGERPYSGNFATPFLTVGFSLTLTILSTAFTYPCIHPHNITPTPSPPSIPAPAKSVPVHSKTGRYNAGPKTQGMCCIPSLILVTYSLHQPLFLSQLPALPPPHDPFFVAQLIMARGMSQTIACTLLVSCFYITSI